MPRLTRPRQWFADLSEVPFPDDAGARDEEADAEPRVRQGTFALDPDPFGPPFEPLPDNAQILVSAGPRASILVHPDEQSDCWISWHDLRLDPDAVIAVEARQGTRTS